MFYNLHRHVLQTPFLIRFSFPAHERSLLTACATWAVGDEILFAVCHHDELLEIPNGQNSVGGLLIETPLVRPFELVLDRV